jgi:hypothetical protein
MKMTMTIKMNYNLFITNKYFKIKIEYLFIIINLVIINIKYNEL